MQRAAGNAAVAGMLSRVPNPALEEMTDPVPVPESVRQQAGAGGATELEDGKGDKSKAHATGEQVDEYINGSPFIKDYVKDKVKGGTKAAGHVHADSPEDFKKNFIAYGKARGMTEQAAKDMEPNVNAFRDGSEIHVHVDRGEFATNIHESMHLFSHDDYRGKLGFNANEGATEFFTKKLCAEQKITRGDFYPDQYGSTKKLADLVGEDKLAAAYYQGKVDDLKAALDKAKTAGTFDKWVKAMQDGKYTEANALL